MKIIHDKRNTGKTKKLIKLCAKNNGQIVCINKIHQMRITREANSLRIGIRVPITFYQFIHNPIAFDMPIYFDDIDLCLKTIAQFATVGGMTVSKGE